MGLTSHEEEFNALVRAFMVEWRKIERLKMADYRTMSPSELETACGDDPNAWAVAFCQIVQPKDSRLHEVAMAEWFTKVILASRGKRKTSNEDTARMAFNASPGISA